MLRLLFEAIEQSFGSSLSTLSFLTYWSGMILLASALLTPLYRRGLEYAAQHLGLEEHWVMPCPKCNRQTVVTRRTCGFCDADLEIPGPLRLWTGATRKGPSLRSRQARWVVQLAANVALLLVAAWLVRSAGVLEPEGEVHRLFLGLALLALAAVAWFGGRAVSLARVGVIPRVRDGLVAVAAIGLTAVSLFLASEARPQPVMVLARFNTENGAALIGGQRLSLPKGEIGFEYLQLDHEVLDYHGVVGIAMLGGERVPVGRCPLFRPVVNHLRNHPDAYAARGLTVRARTDRHRVNPDQAYEIVQREGQVLIRVAQ